MLLQTITNVFCKKGRILLVSSKDCSIFARQNVLFGVIFPLSRQMRETIRHRGVIEEVAGRTVKVRIMQNSACSSCKIATHCNASETKVKIIEATVGSGSNYSLGEEVVVSTTLHVVGRAMTVGFILPFVVMVASLLLAFLVTSDEITSAFMAVLSIVPYYLIIYMLRGRLSRGVVFHVENKN